MREGPRNKREKEKKERRKERKEGTNTNPKKMNATNPQYRSKFNPNGPAGYFLTFHTYGTWFHGDHRGSVDRKGNTIPGTPVLSPDPDLVRLQASRLKHPPVTFTQSQRRSIDSTVRQVCAHKKWLVHAVNARTQHIHVVVTASKAPELVMNALKSWCTRRMREQGLWNADYSPWSRHGSTRYLWDKKAILGASNYVVHGQD